MDNRKEITNVTADVILENETFVIQLTDSEKEDLKDELSKVSIEIKDKEDSLKTFSKSIRESLKPLKESHTEMVTMLRDGAKTQKGTLLGEYDYESRKIHFYDSNGFYVRSERLPNNVQMTINNGRLKAAN